MFQKGKMLAKASDHLKVVSLENHKYRKNIYYTKSTDKLFQLLVEVDWDLGYNITQEGSDYYL